MSLRSSLTKFVTLRNNPISRSAAAFKADPQTRCYGNAPARILNLRNVAKFLLSQHCPLGARRFDAPRFLSAARCTAAQGAKRKLYDKMSAALQIDKGPYGATSGQRYLRWAAAFVASDPVLANACLRIKCSDKLASQMCA